MEEDKLYLDQVQDEQESQLETDTSEQSEESQEETTTDEEAKEEKVEFYTNEELEELLKTDGQVDFNKLSPEGQAIWKSVDRGLKPKLEEAARLREQMANQQRVTQQQPQTTAQPGTLMDAFYQNPDGVLTQVRDRLYQAKMQDPYSQDVVKLEQLRDDLTEKRNAMVNYQYRVKSMADDAERTVRASIPDYDTKREKLSQFAQEVGFTDQDITTLTNPAIMGMMGLGHLPATLTLALNKLYDQANAGDLKKREVKEQIKVEKAGTGFKQKKEEDWSETDYIKMRDKSSIL